jgi:hypothetical protein
LQTPIFLAPATLGLSLLYQPEIHMKKYLTLATTVLSFVAHADNNEQNMNYNQNHNTPTAVSGAAALAGAASKASAVSANSNDSSASLSSTTSVGTSTNINFQSPTPLRQTTNTVRQYSTPDVMVTGPASGPCTGASGGLAGSWMGGGIGFNAATVDPACTLRENVRVLMLVLPALRGADAEEVRLLVMSMIRRMDPPAPAPTTVAEMR